MKVTICLTILLQGISVQSNANLTDTLNVVKKEVLSSVTFQLYASKIRQLDSVQAFREFENMDRIAEQRKHHQLKVYAMFFRGKFCYDKYIWKYKSPLTYFKKAMLLTTNSEFMEAEILFYLGMWYYFGEKNYPIAFEHLLKAHDMAEKIGFKAFPDAGELLNNLSVVYYHYGEYEKAIDLLHLAKQFPVNIPSIEVEIYNTLGIIYRDLDNNDSAIFYFDKALTVAKQKNIEAWVGIATGNLGSVYYKLDKKQEALSYLLSDYNVSIEKKQTGSAANASLLIAQIYFEQDKIDSAYQMLLKGEELARSYNDPRIYILLYKNLSRFYRIRGDFSKALAYSDSMISLRDSISKANDIKILEKTRNKIETESHLANIQLLESKKNKQILVRNGIIGISVLSLIIVLQTFRKIRFRQKKNLEILELEKKRSADELSNAQTLLNSYIESLKQKNQLIEQFHVEIEQLQHFNDVRASSEKEEILMRLQEATILTDDDWMSFKRLFSRVNPDFFIKLNDKFPALTQAETRLLTLYKLGLSVKEKANMLGISPDSVRRTQQRLNKKLGKTEQEILDEIAEPV